MALCGKCGFTFDPASVPGGQCPRCLLLGLHEDSFEGLHADPSSQEPSISLEDDELAAELPGFELVERIGRGGMGVVWRARERVLDRYVAIKLLRNASNDTAFVERFTREARVMARLNHPNIVTLFSFGRTRSNHCYLVMEMVEGTDLAHLLAQDALDLPASLTIAAEVCRALSHAHDAGFVHRDIKPGNVLIDTRGQVKVADFGLARLNRKSDTTTLSITQQGFAVGTPHYVAPEQANGKGLEDHRADIYSLGVMLYQLLTKELPRGVFKPPSLKQKMDKRLDKIVLRALQEEPEKRYQNVAQMGGDIQKVRETVDPALLEGMKTARHATRWRLRFEMGLAVAVSILLGTMAAWYAREWLDVPARDSDKAELAASIDGGVRVLNATQVPKAAGLTIVREVRLQPPSMPGGTRFGRAVRLWNNWLAVGAPQDASADGSGHGSVYLYQRRSDGTWAFVQRLSNPDEETEVQFGYSLAINNGWLVVGAPSYASRVPGRAHLYHFAGPRQGWMHHGASLPRPAARSNTFGISVSMGGGRLAIMTTERVPSGRRSAGALNLYTLGAGGNDWTPEPFKVLEGQLSRTAPVLMSGELMVPFAGADGNNPQPDGTGLMLHRFEGSGLQTKSMAPASVSGRNAFTSIAGSPDRVVAGASNANDKDGRCWVLKKQSDGSWAEESLLVPPPGFEGAEFGKSVAVRGHWLAVGADHHSTTATRDPAGAVCVFKNSGGTNASWTQVLTLAPSEGDVLGDFGNSLAVGDQFIAVGAPDSASLDRGTGRNLMGAVVIYELEEGLGAE